MLGAKHHYLNVIIEGTSEEKDE